MVLQPLWFVGPCACGVHAEDRADSDKDGFLTKDEVLQLSESLLFIFRNETGDHYLATVSRLLQNTFEYAESLSQEGEVTHTSDMFGSPTVSTSVAHTSSENPNAPYVSLATFRMVVLADELLESFFETGRSSLQTSCCIFRANCLPADLTKSWELEEQIDETQLRTGFLGGLLNVIATDENKVRFLMLKLYNLRRQTSLQDRMNKLADAVGQRLEIQSERIIFSWQ